MRLLLEQNIQINKFHLRCKVAKNIKIKIMAEQNNFLELESKIVDALKNVFDPEIPASIYDMGMIYEINVDENKIAHILMTVTAPNCPVADSLPIEVHNKVKEIEGISDVNVVMTFDPPWNEDMMSEVAKLELGLL